MSRFELYAVGPLGVAEVWERVADPRRWPSWTDADAVDVPGGEPLVLGATVVTRAHGRTLSWQVVTLGSRLLELLARVPDGELGLGVRVQRDGSGSRAILAGAFAADGARARLTFALLGGPALRRRFDRWGQALVGR